MRLHISVKHSNTKTPLKSFPWLSDFYLRTDGHTGKAIRHRYSSFCCERTKKKDRDWASTWNFSAWFTLFTTTNVF